jgi:hypothetical protein
MGTTMKLALPAIALVACLIGATRAAADPRLDEMVYSPFVLNHVAEFEVRHGQQLDGATAGVATSVFEAEYGLNDRVSLALVGTLASAPGRTSRFDGVGIEGVVYLGQVPKIGVDTGLYLEYTHGLHGEPDVAEAKLLLAKTAGRFQGLANLIIERPLGGPAGQNFASYGYAVSATWQTFGALRLGAEAFGDLGDDHGFLTRPVGAYFGPQLKWEGRPPGSPVEIDLDIGWLAAVGADRNEARSQVKIAVELERRF